MNYDRNQLTAADSLRKIILKSNIFLVDTVLLSKTGWENEVGFKPLTGKNPFMKMKFKIEFNPLYRKLEK